MAEALGSAGEAGAPVTLVAAGSGPRWMRRAEIDTSAPFESVKEAVTRFGGSGHWKPQHHRQQFPPFDSEKHHCFGEVDIAVVEEQKAKLEKDLMVKERETLDVLKELEMTKRIVDGLKLKLQKEASEVTKSSEINPNSTKVHPIMEAEEKNHNILENHVNQAGASAGSKPSPGLILMELKQAKLNLNRTTSDLAGIRASVESLNSKIENEKILLAKTRERLISNSVKISSLEEELKQTNLILQLTKQAENNRCKNPPGFSKELHQLSSETEQFRKMADATKCEILKMTTEIEQTKASIKTAEIRWFAAKKMEEAAKAAEAVALAEIKALANSENSAAASQKTSGVTLSVEEYDTLTREAQQAEELSMKRIEAAMAQVDEANRSKIELLKKVEEAAAVVKTSRKALEEAVNRVEAANRGKLAVEEALRKWRSEHGQKRRSVHNSTKFKNSGPGHHRRDPRMLDVNGCSLITDGSKSVLRPTLSIGQILSRKLMGPEDFEEVTLENIPVKPKVSLGQMLSRRQGVLSPPRSEDGAARKQFSAKRKKFGFVGFSLILAKQNKKNKKQAWSPK